MEIVINENLQSTAERLANERSMTVRVYVQNYIESHLLSQYKQELTSKITNKKASDLATIEAAIAPIIEAIRVRDYTPPPDVLIPK